MKPYNPTTQAGRRYLRSLAILMVAYVIVLFGAYTLVERFQPGSPLRYLLLLVPLVPAVLMVPTMVRYLQETDEFERRVVTESMAVAAGITAVLALTYGFLENAGLPHLSAWWTWVVLMGSWAIARFFVARRYQ